MKKTVFFDADGTLCHMRTGMTDNTKEALLELHEAGIGLVLCTGRCLPLVGSELRSLPFEGYITSGGACIRKDQRKTEKLLKTELVAAVLEMTRETNAHPILCGENLCLYDEKRMTAEVDPWLPYSQSVREFYLPLTAWNPKLPVNKICIKSNVPWAAAEIVRQLKDRFGCPVDVGNNPEKPGIYEAEIFPEGCSKGNALREYLVMDGICDSAGRRRENAEVWAMGDGGNDIAMFRAADHSIAMGDASDVVQSEAEFVTDTFARDGAACACRRWILGL